MAPVYDVIVESGEDFNYFLSSVNKALKEGWKLQGGVSIGETENDHIYAQALIKEEQGE
jgi:hypothetical protein